MRATAQQSNAKFKKRFEKFLNAAMHYPCASFSSHQPTSGLENANEEFPRKMGYIHFGQFEIFAIEAAEI